MHIGHSWPKMSMHSYDLIKAMWKNKRNTMEKRSGQPNFKMSTESHDCSPPVSPAHSCLRNAWQRNQFPVMTSQVSTTYNRHISLQKSFRQTAECTVRPGLWVPRSASAGVEQTWPTRSSWISGRYKSEMIAPLSAVAGCSNKWAAGSFPQRESKNESSSKFLDLT